MVRVLAVSLLLWLAAAPGRRVHAQTSPEGSAVMAPASALPSPAESEPSADTQQAYFRVVRTAIAEFDAGRFAEARALFLRAHELWPSARTWRTLGMTAFELSLYPRAQAELQQALDDLRRPLDEAQRKQVRALLEQTRAFVGRYRVRLTPREAVLRLDGVLVTLSGDDTLLLAVGSHELHAQADGHSELRVPVLVQGHEEDELLDLQLAKAEPAAPPEPKPPAPAPAVDPPPATPEAVDLRAADANRTRRRRLAQWLTIGSTAVVSSAGIALLASGIRAYGVVRSPEDGQLSYRAWQDKEARYPRLLGAGGALMGLGLLGLASGLWWKLGEQQTPTVQLSLERRGLLLQGRF